LAFSLHELGWLLYFTGKYKEAEPYLLKALSIGERTLGILNRQTLRTLGALALLYQNCSDLGTDPEPYFRRAIDATKSENDLQETYISNLYRLANHLADRKSFEQADELFQQVLMFLNNLSSPSDLDTDWIARGCVQYFQSRGNEQVVQKLESRQHDAGAYRKMVQERLRHAERTLSQDDPELAEALLGAGNNAIFEGNYHEAEPLLTRALDVCTRIHGEKSSQTIFALNRVCIVKRLLRKFDEAESAIQRAVDGARTYFCDNGLYPWTLENLALLREAEGTIDDAEVGFAEAVAVREKISGFPSYEIAEALYHQSGCLLRVGKLGPAENAIRRAISVMDRVSELSDYEKSDYLSTLASILEGTGRNDESVEARNRAEQLFETARQRDVDQE